MRSVSVVSALTLALILAATASVALAVPPGLKDIEARTDFAGFYKDRSDGGSDTYLFTGDAEGALEELLSHYPDESKFAIRTVTYTLAELRAVQDELEERWDDLRSAGFDIREIGVDVIGNRVDIGVFGSLPPVREALAEYGDKVQVVWSEGAFTEPEPDRRLTSVKNRDGIRVRITLDDNHLVAGEPIWLRTKVKNTRDTPVFYATDGCEVSVEVSGQMLGQRWRPGTPVDEAAIEADGRDPGYDLKWRTENWSRAGDEAVHLAFFPEQLVGRRIPACDSIGITHRIPPGGIVEQRLRWDGLAVPRLAPPPDGMARITGSFTPARLDGPERPAIEVGFDVPVVGGLQPGMLHPMEAIDAALADPDFRDLIEPVKVSKGNVEVIRFDSEHDAWIVGVCGRFDGQRGYWKVAIVDPMTGDVTEIVDRPVGKSCATGPWPET